MNIDSLLYALHKQTDECTIKYAHYYSGDHSINIISDDVFNQITSKQALYEFLKNKKIFYYSHPFPEMRAFQCNNIDIIKAKDVNSWDLFDNGRYAYIISENTYNMCYRPNWPLSEV